MRVPRMTGAPGTLRVVGAVLAAGCGALDIALVESDGCEIARKLELRRIPLFDGVAAAGAAVERFLGDLALQPSAIDLLAVSDKVDAGALAQLAKRLDLAIRIIDPGQQWPNRPRAERVALAAARAEVSSSRMACQNPR